jgi:hypothetical protein
MWKFLRREDAVVDGLVTRCARGAQAVKEQGRTGMTSWNDLHWRKPERIIDFDRAAPSPQEADRFPWNLEIPFIPGTTPIQEAKDLLQLASQVEHGLMVEYL